MYQLPGFRSCSEGFEESLYLAETVNTIQEAVANNTFTIDMQEVKNLKAELLSCYSGALKKNVQIKLVIRNYKSGNREGGEGWLE